MLTEPVVTSYRADSGQLLAALEQIKASQTQLSASVDKQSASLTAQNKKLNESIAFWGKLNVGIAMIPGVIGKIQSAFSEAAELLKAKSAAAGVSIENLDDALKGQLKTTELYSLAASINTAKVKLNAEQQKVLAGAIRQLGLEGKNVTEVTKDFQKVLASGEANELKKYGIGVVDINGKAKDLAAVFRDDLEPMASKASKTLETSGEAMQRAANDLSDAFTEAKTVLAEFGAEVTSMVSGRRGDDMLSFTGMMVSLAGMGGQSGVAARVQDEMARLQKLKDAGAAWQNAVNSKWTRHEADRKAKQDELDAIAADIVVDGDKKVGRSGGRSRGPSAAEQAALASYWASINAANAAVPAAMEARTFDALPIDALAEHMTTIDGVLARTAAFYGSSNWFEQTIGPASYFNVYAEGFGMLEDAVRSAAEAWITGSEGGVSAAKRAAAGRLTTVATEAAVQAAYNGAWAINDFAFGDVAHGTMRLAAAAKFAGVAIAAGAGARLLGSGSGSAAPGGVGGAAPALSGNTAEAGNGAATNSVIVYGDSFADDSPRMRARQARRLVRRAREFN